MVEPHGDSGSSISLGRPVDAGRLRGARLVRPHRAPASRHPPYLLVVRVAVLVHDLRPVAQHRRVRLLRARSCATAPIRPRASARRRSRCSSPCAPSPSRSAPCCSPGSCSPSSPSSSRACRTRSRRCCGTRSTARAIGLVLLGLVVLYVLGSLLHFRPLVIRSFHIEYPRPAVMVRQLVAAPLELLGAAGIIYFALPETGNPGLRRRAGGLPRLVLGRPHQPRPRRPRRVRARLRGHHARRAEGGGARRPDHLQGVLPSHPVRVGHHGGAAVRAGPGGAGLAGPDDRAGHLAGALALAHADRVAADRCHPGPSARPTASNPPSGRIDF